MERKQETGMRHMTAEPQLGLLCDGFEMVVQCGMSDSGFYSAFIYI